MTLKGQRNHYNVKLLRGYGISINVKDNQIILKNGQNDITGISENGLYPFVRISLLLA
jgi:CRISPR-associated protein Cas1